MPEAVVIGAGPAGLSAAFELQKNSIHSTILEADSTVGGISRTVRYRGYRFDIGGHRFFSKIPLVNSIWEEMLGEEMLVRPRLSRIHYRGHLFDYPLKPLNALAGLGPAESLAVCLSYAGAKLRPSKREENFEQWVVSRFGHRLYNIFFKTYTEKVWGVPCSEISADWAAQRIKNLSLREALLNAFLGNGSNGKVITTLIDEFRYPRLGPGMMWEACRNLLSDRGNETRLESRVRRLEHDGRRVQRVVALNRDGTELRYGADHFISSMPLRDLVRSLDPAPPDEILKAAEALRYRDYLTVVLVIKRADVFKDNWIYIHSPEVTVGRIQNYKNWSEEMVPDPDYTSLGLEYFLWKTDEEWTWPDERLIERGIRETAALGMVDPEEVVDGTVVRMEKAYPVYDAAYQHSVETIRGYLSTLANLQTIGRNGQHRYNNQDHSMLTGVYAARNAADKSRAYDTWSVNVEQEYHEEEQEEPGSGRQVIARPVDPAAVRRRSAEQFVESSFLPIDPFSMGLALAITAGIGLLLVTAILLLKGGRPIGPNLSLLGQFLPGYRVSRVGTLLGLIEGGAVGFLVGWLGAHLRNASVRLFVKWQQFRAEAQQRRDLLDKV